MTKKIRISLLAASLVMLTWVISCDEVEDLKDCTDCSDDAPYGAVDGNGCYATLSECNDNESGNCVICQ